MILLWMTPLRHASFFERVAFFTFTTASSWLASDPPTVYMNQGSPIPSCSYTNPCFIHCIKVSKYINFEASSPQDSISSHRVRNSPVHHATSPLDREGSANILATAFVRSQRLRTRILLPASRVCFARVTSATSLVMEPDPLPSHRRRENSSRTTAITRRSRHRTMG